MEDSKESLIAVFAPKILSRISNLTYNGSKTSERRSYALDRVVI